MQDGRVVGGDYKGMPVVTSFDSQKVWIKTKPFGFSKKDRLMIDTDTVKKYEVVNEESNTSGSMMKEMMFGTAAALSTKKRVMVSIEFKNGKKSLVECDNRIFKTIQTACYK